MPRSTGQVRSEVIMRMKAALQAGKSASAFIRDMSKRGLSYRRTEMLSDWRSAGNIEKKTGLVRYVRKGYTPSPATYADVSWNLSREYMTKVRIESRIRPGAPVETRFVNIVHDTPMTPEQLESEVRKQGGNWYAERRNEMLVVIPETALHRIPG